MKIEVDRTGETPVLLLPGRIDLTNSHEMRDILLSLCEEGFLEILLDFSNLYSMDSTGIGKLIIVQKRMKEKGGSLKITNVSAPNIRHLFQAINLQQEIKIMDEFFQ